jgi:hypothetical protein
MQIKIKSAVFAFSLFLNAASALIFVSASFSKTQRLSFFAPGENCVTAAAVVSFPKDESAVFGPVEITLKPREKAFLQFSVLSGGRQGNVLLSALYDRGVVSISQTGFGIEITALSPGSTLMQTLTNDGLKEIALITVK